MLTTKTILLWQLIWLSCIFSESVKIGISKPLATSTTTTALPSTTSEMATEENASDSASPTAVSTPYTTTTMKPILTTEEPEWPEFPPRKETTTKKPTTTTTKKPKTTTTKKPLTTTSTAMPTTKVPDVANNNTQASIDTLALSVQPSWHVHKYCFCDMTFQSCDINCCCDPDCTPEALSVFKCLKDKTHDFELHEGRFEDFKFQHGLPSCEVNDGWLCVFRTNIPPVVERVPSSYADTSQYYKWPNMFKDNEQIEHGSHYMYGDILKIVNMETKDVRSFDLPASLKPPQCQGKEPLTHLKSVKFTCLLSSKSQLDEIEQNLVELQGKHKVVTKPIVVGSEELINTRNLKNIVGNITLRWCNADAEINCQNSIMDEGYGLEGAAELQKIQVNIFHNFTNIQGIVIDLWHREEMKENNSDLWLEYEVLFHNKTLKEFKNYENFDISKEMHKITSGPYGYQLGKPLIISKYIPFNKSLALSETNQVIEYFSVDNLYHNTLNVFTKHQGLCKRSNFQHNDVISYGINFAKQCKIRMDNATLLNEEPSKTNFTTICLKLQNITQQQLWGNDLQLMDITTYFISELGKPQNDSNKWLPLNVINADFNPVYGQYLENSHSFVCRNILLSLNYEFHSGTFDTNEAAEQNLIKHANLIMGERHDLEFALDESIEVPLSLTVRFYDINEIALSATSRLIVSHAVYLISFLVIVL